LIEFLGLKKNLSVKYLANHGSNQIKRFIFSGIEEEAN